MSNLIYQQGDCILKRIGIHGIFEIELPEIPSEAKPVKTNLLLKGQTNSHALYGGDFEIFEHEGVLFLDVKSDTTLDHVKDHHSLTPVHAEHHAQTIEVGQYFVSPLMEYDHLLEESRRVID
jgi:hypothetical protein